MKKYHFCLLLSVIACSVSTYPPIIAAETTDSFALKIGKRSIRSELDTKQVPPNDAEEIVEMLAPYLQKNGDCAFASYGETSCKAGRINREVLTSII